MSITFKLFLSKKYPTPFWFFIAVSLALLLNFWGTYLILRIEEPYACSEKSNYDTEPNKNFSDIPTDLIKPHPTNNNNYQEGNPDNHHKSAQIVQSKTLKKITQQAHISSPIYDKGIGIYMPFLLSSIKALSEAENRGGVYE